MMSLRKFESKEKVIILRPGKHSWLADWSASPAGRHVRKVCGTEIIPPAYSLQMPVQVACRRIAELNPGYMVMAAVPETERGRNESSSL
jgi:hypothetical protein